MITIELALVSVAGLAKFFYVFGSVVGVVAVFVI